MHCDGIHVVHCFVANLFFPCTWICNSEPRVGRKPDVDLQSLVIVTFIVTPGPQIRAADCMRRLLASERLEQTHCHRVCRDFMYF